jgi:hypothetical protein
MRAMQRFKTHPFPGPHLLHRKAGYQRALENDGDEDELAGRNEKLLLPRRAKASDGAVDVAKLLRCYGKPQYIMETAVFSPHHHQHHLHSQEQKHLQQMPASLHVPPQHQQPPLAQLLASAVLLLLLILQPCYQQHLLTQQVMAQPLLLLGTPPWRCWLLLVPPQPAVL